MKMKSGFDLNNNFDIKKEGINVTKLLPLSLSEEKTSHMVRGIWSMSGERYAQVQSSLWINMLFLVSFNICPKQYVLV